MKGDPIDFQSRVGREKWPIYQRTGNKSNLKKNDKVIFYLGGQRNMKFMGAAKLSSGIKPEGDDFTVGLSDIDVWKKPVKVQEILDSLAFVGNKKNWGAYFQGGAVWITEKDYNTILEKK
jgi:hypothetical protein